jgi:hypothetical protein
MKLFTEEEIRKVLHPDLFHLILPRMTPIELPSDEEIEKYASKYAADGVIIVGAKWMKEQILNQNK